jgi:aminoglycoside phosphotransferase (APT) family kinase protein
VHRAGLARAGEVPGVESLTGGVSSDIWRVDLERGRVCVKRALPRLRVAQLWEAPVERNRYERLWLQAAGEALPGCVPGVLSWDDEQGLFAMEYVDYPVWKERLRRGDADPAFAAKVGAALARIHAATAGRDDMAKRFPTDAIFYAIRLEPYLVATAEKHPDLREKLLFLSKRTSHQKISLVHGDVSPKNILVGAEGPVLIDAECAWWGDPAFDIAFCLNHLLLKCLWTPSATAAFLASFEALSRSYFEGVDWEPAEVLEQRAAALLPGLFLARVDGKSPVEYLSDEADRERVRRVARRLIADPVSRLSSVAAAWRDEVGS